MKNLHVFVSQPAVNLQDKSSRWQLAAFICVFLEQQVSRYLQRQGGHTKHLSWKYFWRTYWLTYNGVKLVDDKKTIKE